MKKPIHMERILQQIALREDITIQEVRKHMELAIQAGLSSHDPRIQAHWRQIPCKGATPTLEEFIAYISTHVGMDADLPI